MTAVFRSGLCSISSAQARVQASAINAASRARLRSRSAGRAAVRREARPALVEQRAERLDAGALGRDGGRDREVAAEREAQVAHGLRRAGPVGHVDHDDVGDLHQARLDRLHGVAEPGHRDERDRVRQLGDRDLGLAGADGLDQDHVERAGELEQAGDVARRARDRPVRAAAGEAAHEHVVAAHQVRLHPQPVAEHRAAADRARRVDREHADARAGRRVGLDQPAGERALARPRRARDPDDVDGPLHRRQRDQPRRAVLDLGDRASERAPAAALAVAREQRGDVSRRGQARSPRRGSAGGSRPSPTSRSRSTAARRPARRRKAA